MPVHDPDPPAPPIAGQEPRELVTIERFLLDRQPEDSTGSLTRLLYDIALAGKVIAARTRRAGLTQSLGLAGDTNVQGEDQKTLDVEADRAVIGLLTAGGRVAALVSEEQADPILIDDGGPFIVAYDPLDGSSNIDSNVSIGSIFGVFRRRTKDGPTTEEDWLQPGRDLVAAAYVLYGFSTMLVYSTGDGVHAFTLDPEVGEFVLTWSDLRYPDDPAYYSFNRASSPQWADGMRRFVQWLDRPDTPQTSQRYIGSAVADFHRNLLHGGIFGYPGELDRPQGKLRLLYEGAPLAYLAAAAGGDSSDGQQSLLDVVPVDIHQRTPVFVGDAGLVDRLQGVLADGPDPD